MHKGEDYLKMGSSNLANQKLGYNRDLFLQCWTQFLSGLLSITLLSDRLK